MDSLLTIPIYFFTFISLFFEVFLIITYLERRAAISVEEKKVPIQSLPEVSIIVPCYNEEKTISGTVKSLLDLDYPREKLKILIVDDGSKDNTLKVLEQFKSEPSIQIYHKENGGKHTALNHGLERVTSELVGCLDADSFVQRDALKKIVAYFEDKTAMAVTPSIRAYNPKNILERIQNVEYSYGSFVRKIFSHMDSLYVTPGPFSIFRKEVFDKLGNYRPAHNTEDIEIALRMQSHKYKILNCHRAFVDTVTPKNLKGLYKQRLRWTYGFIKNALDYRSLFFNKNHGNLGMLALPLAPIYILSALYIVLTLVFSILERMINHITRLQVTGLNHMMPNISLDWYFINTDSKTFLVTVSLFLLCTIIVIGHKLSGKKVNTLDFLYTFTLYGIISPSWLLVSIYKAIGGKKINWR